VKYGHAEPDGVKYWCVGNEMFGPWQLGYMRLDHYVEKHNRVATAVHKVDPTLKLIGSGDLNSRSRGRRGDGPERGWSEGMLQDCSDNMDLISEHFYVRVPNEDVPKHVVLIVNAIRGKADGHRKLQAGLPNLNGRTIPIAMDEWNY
jgi:alpha-N-arabinofuranosidase